MALIVVLKPGSRSHLKELADASGVLKKAIYLTAFLLATCLADERFFGLGSRVWGLGFGVWGLGF